MVVEQDAAHQAKSFCKWAKELKQKCDISRLLVYKRPGKRFPDIDGESKCQEEEVGWKGQAIELRREG